MKNHSLESVPPSEVESIRSMTEILKAKITREKSATGEIERDAHPKQHGLVRAKFIINNDLPSDLRVGLFKKPGSYDAWLRFSNQNAPIQDDNTPDIRGLAIKLLGVEGTKLLEGHETDTTHDFITISTDRFITKDAAEFDTLLKSMVKNKLCLAWFFITHLRALKNILLANKRFATPLDIRYFSTTPYLLGDEAVKYSVKPRLKSGLNIPKPASPNYLKETMQTQLNQSAVIFDFMIQRRTDANTMPIEDAGKLWDETEAPFIPVATIEIPIQVFTSEAQHRYGIEMSFNPWRCLAEHRPLGGINRARREIYNAISLYRHKENGTQLSEPIKMEFF